MIFKKNYGLKMYAFLGILICGFLVVSAVDGKILERNKEHTISAGSLVPTKSRYNSGNRRDPFRPIIKHPPPSSSSSIYAKPKTVVTPTAPKVKDPTWKLLGVIHGQSGRQAVIQVSPKKRIVVELGSEFTHLGWTVKAINEAEVLLEHSSTVNSVVGSPTPRTFILSFPTSGKS